MLIPQTVDVLLVGNLNYYATQNKHGLPACISNQIYITPAYHTPYFGVVCLFVHEFNWVYADVETMGAPSPEPSVYKKVPSMVRLHSPPKSEPGAFTFDSTDSPQPAKPKVGAHAHLRRIVCHVFSGVCMTCCPCLIVIHVTHIFV